MSRTQRSRPVSYRGTAVNGISRAARRRCGSWTRCSLRLARHKCVVLQDRCDLRAHLGARLVHAAVDRGREIGLEAGGWLRMRQERLDIPLEGGAIRADSDLGHHPSDERKRLLLRGIAVGATAMSAVGATTRARQERAESGSMAILLRSAGSTAGAWRHPRTAAPWLPALQIGPDNGLPGCQVRWARGFFPTVSGTSEDGAPRSPKTSATHGKAKVLHAEKNSVLPRPAPFLGGPHACQLATLCGI